MSSLEQIATDHEAQQEERRKTECKNAVQSTLKKLFYLLTPQIKKEFNFTEEYKVSKETYDPVRIVVELVGYIFVNDIRVETNLIRKYDWQEKFYFQARIGNQSIVTSYEFTLDTEGNPVIRNSNIEIEAGKFLSAIKFNINQYNKNFLEKYDRSVNELSSYSAYKAIEEIKTCPYITATERARLLSTYVPYAEQKEKEEKETNEKRNETVKQIYAIVKEGQRLEAEHVNKLTQMTVELRKKYCKPFELYKTCFYPEGLNFVDLRINPEKEDDEYEYESLKEYIHSASEPIKGEYIKAVRGSLLYEVKITGHISYIEKIVIDPISQTHYAKYIRVAPLQFKHHSFALYVNPYEADRILAEINELKVEHFNFEAYLESHGVKRGVSGDYYFA